MSNICLIIIFVVINSDETVSGLIFRERMLFVCVAFYDLSVGVYEKTKIKYEKL
jgi:hypothetical protein